jgi:hypothetical protein
MRNFRARDIASKRGEETHIKRRKLQEAISFRPVSLLMGPWFLLRPGHRQRSQSTKGSRGALGTEGLSCGT